MNVINVEFEEDFEIEQVFTENDPITSQGKSY